jgi:hypothetical protein
MRTLVISSYRGGFNEKILDAFSVDVLITGKFSLVRSLELDSWANWGISQTSFVSIWCRLVNLEHLEVYDVDDDDLLSPLVWTLLLTNPHFPVRTLKFCTTDLGFVDRSEITRNLALPATVTFVEVHLAGTEEEHRILFETHQRLPDLKRLELYFQSDSHVIASFPKLLWRLKWAYIYLPDHAYLLGTDSGIEYLSIGQWYDNFTTDFTWNLMAGMSKLRTVYVRGVPTSMLVGLPMAPQIR